LIGKSTEFKIHFTSEDLLCAVMIHSDEFISMGPWYVDFHE